MLSLVPRPVDQEQEEASVSSMTGHLRLVASSVLLLALAGCSLFTPGDGTQSKAPTDKSTPTVSLTTSASPSPSPAVVIDPAAAPVTPQFFGVHDHDPLSWPDAPVGSLRAWDSGVTWRLIETSPGSFDFSLLDATVEKAEANGSDVLLVLGQTPEFHATDPASESFYGAGASSPPRLAAWKRYVREVAERYAGRPVVLQVWNEANVAGFWSGTPAQMARLTKAAYDVLATVLPRPTLVAPALVTRLIGQRAWIDDFWAQQVDGAQVADFVDVVSLQLYPEADGTPESSMELLAAIRVVLARHGVTKPIWNTEVNYGLTGLPVSPTATKQQIANVARTYLLNAANRVERVYWYGWDQQQIVDTLTTYADGVTVTPAGRAFRTVQRWMEGATVQSCGADALGTYLCTLTYDGGVRRVYWNPSVEASVELPSGSTRLQRLAGDAHAIPTTSNLEVDGVPLMVESPN